MEPIFCGYSLTSFFFILAEASNAHDVTSPVALMTSPFHFSWGFKCSWYCIM